jgi:hypothetical protein
VQDLNDLLHRGITQALAALVEGLGEANGGILHVLVGFLRPTYENKVLTLRKPLMSILVIEADAEEPDHLALVAVTFAGHRVSSVVE